jgi:hypothetical protein
MAGPASRAEGATMRRSWVRLVGYVGAALVGLVIGAMIAWLAVASTLCATWGGTCSAEQEATTRGLWALALAAPFALVGLYALFDHGVDWLRRRRSRRR